ncbi:hypothetical protein [Nocardia asiatica]|uniref:hypothetical protein n=1 Tax=Nocardia asiatica TaxID=209252 RepID=UPI002458380B|nr:hypothetical protein [Nocardia asiatica]
MSDLRLTQAQLHQQLLDIRTERGRLTAQDVVDVARDEAHPLHSRFEWNDAVAGEAYRRVQAAELIRSVRIVYAQSPDGEERRVRAWSAFPDEPTRQGYMPTEEVVQDPFAAKLLLRQAERELTAFKRKYGHLKEFAALVAETLTDGAA